MFDPLGELLVRIGLLTQEQWRQVRAGLPAGADLAAVLDRIEALPAWWAPAGTAAPALTAYQRRWAQRLHDKGRLPRLARALRWDDYLVLRQLGEGGMGTVYEAWDLRERRRVAVKRIKGNSVETYRRFRREARIQKHLCHPNVVRFLRLARARGDTLLVQEHIDGRTIAQEVKARGPIPWQEVVGWALDVLAALEYAHGLKIIHRDLKPANIILYRRGDGLGAKVLDLGLAKCLDPSAMTQTTTRDAVTVGDALLGTYEYMAPEQWRGAEEIVAASDVYSLGGTLYFALAGGKPPFVADSPVAYCNAHTNLPPPRLCEAQPAVPEALDALVQQMLAKDPAKRGSAGRLIEQFRRLLPGPPPPPAAPAVPDHLPRPAPADDRFDPFPDQSHSPLSGPRAFVRALFVSRGMGTRLLFVVLAVLVVAAALLLYFHR